MKNSNLTEGFTLIEILVVATIIGLLTTVGATGFQSVTRGGRDALRKADLEQIRSAMEIYKSENNHYPTPTGGFPDISSDYINPYPDDPKPSIYKYYYNQTTSLDYELCAHLENGNDIDDFCGGINNCDANPSDSLTVKCNKRTVNP